MGMDDVGTILYWCEGSKRERGRRIEFVNSDPFDDFHIHEIPSFQEGDEKRIRARTMIHPKDDENLRGST